jgi:hypothetical protein
MERRPNPSLPLEPPNIRVKSVDLGFARQKTEKPVSRGNIHSGKISHIKILKLDQTSLRELIWKNLRKERHIEKLQPLFVAVRLSRTPFFIERIKHGDQGKYTGV